MSEHKEIIRRLAAIAKDRKWLAKQLGMSFDTVRQYLQPKGKRTREFLAEVDRIIVLEEARQRENRSDSPPWNVIFETAEQFDRADRASRLTDAESLVDFCRGVILEKSDELLMKREPHRYPTGRTRAQKAAETPEKKSSQP